MKIVGYGDSLFGGTFEVHSSFDKIVNFKKIEEEFLFLNSILDISMGSGPNNIFLDGNLSDVYRVSVSDSEIKMILKSGRVISEKISAAKTYNSKLKLNLKDHYQLKEILDLIEIEIKVRASKDSLIYLLDDHFEDPSNQVDILMRDRFRNVLKRFITTNRGEELVALRGLGIGLTPSGDDFLAGAIAASVILGDSEGAYKIYSFSLGDNLVSNTLFHNMKNGLYHERLKLLFTTIFSCDVECIKDRMGDLIDSYLDIGHTSGADFLVGLVIFLRHLGRIYGS